MDFAFSEDQEALREVARRFLDDVWPISALPGLPGATESPDRSAEWAAVARLGWLEPDLGVLEHAVLFEETGRTLLPLPLFSTLALAEPAMRDRDLRADIGAGRLRLTLAWASAAGDETILGALRQGPPALRSTTDGRITGTAALVPDAAQADAIVVLAGTDAGDAVVALVDADATVITPLDTLDVTRPLADVRFAGAPSRPLVTGPEVRPVLQRIRRGALVAAACEAVGVADRALQIATEHARVREQFGRPIGSFQAVAHRITDSYVDVQLARSLAYWAAWTLGEHDAGETDLPDVDVAAATAKAVAAKAAVSTCESAIQVLGGLGFTWEHPVHRFYKRAKWLEAFEGGARAVRAEVANFLFRTARMEDDHAHPAAVAALEGSGHA